MLLQHNVNYICNGEFIIFDKSFVCTTDLNFQSVLFAEDCYKLVEVFFVTLHHVTKHKNFKNNIALFFEQIAALWFFVTTHVSHL
jgi:hypothetical protein